MKRFPTLSLFWFTLFALTALSALALWPAGPAASAPDSGFFYDSFEEIGSGGWDAAVGDLDGDADLDLYLANDGADAVWLNQGGVQGGTTGHYADSGQFLGDTLTVAVALGDVDGDGDLDAFLLDNLGYLVVLLNPGGSQGGTAGQLAPSGQTMEENLTSDVALGDLDNDGDLDAFITRSVGRPNKVWLNDGGAQAGTPGQFSDSGQTLGDTGSTSVALGDVDDDGDLDAFVADDGPNHLWINQGGSQSGTPGQFQDSGQTLGDRFSLTVALGDVDGDGDLDAYVGNNAGDDDAVWINQGGVQGGTPGAFQDSGQSLSTGATRGVALGDVDGDGDLDAFLARAGANAVWINQGGDQGGTAGQFQDGGQQIGDAFSEAVALGDADGDGDPDAFVANPYAANRLLTNGETTLPQAAFDVVREPNDDGDDVAYWAQGGTAMLPVVLSHPVTQTVDVYVRVEGPSGTMTETLTYPAGEQLQLLNLENPDPDPTETFTLILRVAPGGLPPADSVETDRLLFIFVDGAQGPQTCFLCYVEWLGRLLGVDPALWTLHEATLAEQESAPQWDYYTALFRIYSPEMSDQVARHPSLLWSAVGVLDQFKPAVQALAGDDGGSYTIDRSLAEGMDGFFADLAAEAGPGLQAAIEQERAALDLPSFTGLTMEEAWDHLVIQRPITQSYVTITLKAGPPQTVVPEE